MVRASDDADPVIESDAAFTSVVPAVDHLVAQLPGRLVAYDATTGDEVWSLDTVGSLATVVDDGVVTATYSPDDDSTELRYYR